MSQTPGQPILYTDGLKIGQQVSISWTNSGRTFKAFGAVSKINKKSIKVKLPAGIMDPRSGGTVYPPGFEIHIPIPGTNFNGAWYR